MASGFKYDLKPMEDNMPEMCRFDTVYRYSGGFNLVTTNLSGVLPPLCPLALDFKTRKATPIFNVKVHKAIAANETALQIEKGSLVYVGMHLGNGTNGGTVTKIDKSKNGYDEVTLATSPTLVAKIGDVLFEAKATNGKEPKATANALNYAATKVEEGATVTAIGQAFEIRPSKLIAPISEKDKASLGDRFMFTY
ncbi:hypothetical protein EVA_02109 [gut metagenome]|uniref:Uncharacterized protein n=1 Tax=gut metagenome TaxID=749906 RepID=J9GNR6_9ZZZZ